MKRCFALCSYKSYSDSSNNNLSILIRWPLLGMPPALLVLGTRYASRVTGNSETPVLGSRYRRATRRPVVMPRPESAVSPPPPPRATTRTGTPHTVPGSRDLPSHGTTVMSSVPGTSLGRGGRWWVAVDWLQSLKGNKVYSRCFEALTLLRFYCNDVAWCYWWKRAFGRWTVGVSS